MPFIYETYDTVSRSGFKDFQADLPDYITKNLKHPLRPYQKEAIGRYLHYKWIQIELFLSKSSTIWRRVLVKPCSWLR
jgi:hypothetical protein